MRPEEAIAALFLIPTTWLTGVAHYFAPWSGVVGPRFAGGVLRIESEFQENLIRWQLVGLAILLGAMFAGATTDNGLKQGLFAGLLTASVFVGIQAANPNPKVRYEITVATAIVAAGLSLVGGCFGAALFPKVAKVQKKAIPY